MDAPPSKRRRSSSTTSISSRPYKKRKRTYSKRRTLLYKAVRDVQEKKYFDTSLTALALTLSSSGTVYPSMALVSVGTGASNMVGRRIRVTSIHVRAYITVPQETGALAGLNSAAENRLDLFIDRQPQGTAPSIAAIYETSTINTFLDMEHSTRFKLLRIFNKPINRTPVFNSGATTFNLGTALEPVDFHVNCDERIEYETQAGIGRVIGEITTNNIFLAGFSTSNSASLVGFVRIRFTDS